MKAVVLLACALTAAACTSSPLAPGVDEPLTLTRLRQEPFTFTYNSGLRDSQRLAVRDVTAWQQVWTAIWTGHSPQPTLPAIDFGREMVIVAALGERPTGGFSIFIDGVTESASRVSIQVRSVSPGSRCAVTLALTQPVDIARVTRRDGLVSFAETSLIQDCN